ncbi:MULTISPECIES: hypothetical protein [Pseudoxanthomonas]|uniref:N-acetylglucosaminyl-diphospho-decaprenol L-rhamnosyltransferase n=1 Tax=Pseudoxanthomonas winnipegensis TaxID=2480810 RepID=A0AAW8GB56_9GAMM|nr:MULTISPECIES: hypothetical protein [Pseudoxanthomonas]MDQ1119635.1 N-acetylglucosaminyl-diphospho-decaprenol L-rhamnosyltransferase [Pseudoxanthomonas winnipegensis]MDQ1132830.1 N-acetylglucosaminyl-diphospho-decaprenol L-rhamnosyltransferase [Pseudoxanthomonas winnipegensis]MDR6137163.1 N-acetylglucosaminyl-diphospho-decaprenol L-rhamnosyltransferase [Pseudoxanthomonas sp. SORGH_AS_0997]
MTAAVTLHFRKPELTRKCVDSLLADGWYPVLVWDNSGDDGVSLLSLEAHYAGDDRVWMATQSKNLGFGQGVNASLAELGRRGYGGPVLLVNNDAEIVPGLHEALSAQLQASPSVALFAPKVRQDGQIQGWMYYQPWLGLVKRSPSFGSFSYLSGCCLLVKRSDNAMPLFDEDFFMYGEDVLLSWEMRRRGAAVVLLDEVYVNHLGSASSGQATALYERLVARSHWLLAKKLASNAASRACMQLLRLGALFARACIRSWRYRSLVPLRALRHIFKDT